MKDNMNEDKFTENIDVLIESIKHEGLDRDTIEIIVRYLKIALNNNIDRDVVSNQIDRILNEI